VFRGLTRWSADPSIAPARRLIALRPRSRSRLTPSRIGSSCAVPDGVVARRLRAESLSVPAADGIMAGYLCA
jgi:hypothetical protein